MSDSVSKILIEKCGVAFFLVVILALAIIAILHFGVKFDLNEFIESRKKRHRKLAQNYCPHMVFIPRHDNSFQVNSLFYTPFGTPNWFCFRCGAVLPYEPASRGSRGQSNLLSQSSKDLQKGDEEIRQACKKISLDFNNSRIKYGGASIGDSVTKRLLSYHSSAIRPLTRNIVLRGQEVASVITR